MMETTLNELFKNKFNRIYAYEVCALAIAFDIEPHILFESFMISWFTFNRHHGLSQRQFYGDGERPILGLAQPHTGDESKG